ncbi:MAG: hypothetical protein ACXVHS_01980 [Methanobacterium sp.]
MALVMDPVIILNLIFCIIIVILAIVGYRKTDNVIPLYIGLSFGLFGISHLATILGFSSSTTALVVIRGFAYIVIIYALYIIAFRRNE